MKKKIMTGLVLVFGVILFAGCDKKVEKEVEKKLSIGTAQYAAHGTRSFAVTTVVLDNDKVEMVYIDEYQYVAKDEYECVPNSDKDFGAVLTDQTKCLASKRLNNTAYSQGMKDKAQATMTLEAGYEAIEKFAIGKTVEELEAALTNKTPEEVVDAVSGSTLVDTKGYLESIIEAAKVAQKQAK